MTLDQLSGLEILALTIYGEARGEPVQGQIAVASVIRNRVLKKSNNTSLQLFKEVCLKKRQFSCWNADDANRKMLDKLIADWDYSKDFTDKILQQCWWIARGIYNNYLVDPTFKSDHYMTTKIYTTKMPTWAKGMKVTVVIGNHTFLK